MRTNNHLKKVLAEFVVVRHFMFISNVRKGEFIVRPLNFMTMFIISLRAKFRNPNVRNAGAHCV
jgi:hypothetical protein